MRLGDGSDLPGDNDPRKNDIGIIYVAPGDDRQSVLTAIWTQDKLGRKQIALLLPERNRAFAQAIDFDGLKQMRKELQAELVIVAPDGSSVADLARQRRFTVYSTLDDYATALREGEAPADTGRQGRSSKRKPAAAARPPSPPSTPVDADSASSPPSFPPPSAPPFEMEESPAQARAANEGQVNTEDVLVTPDEMDETQMFPVELPLVPGQTSPPNESAASRTTAEPAPPAKEPEQEAEAAPPPSPTPARASALSSPPGRAMPILFPRPAGVVPSGSIPATPTVYVQSGPPGPVGGARAARSWRGWFLAGGIILLLLVLGFFLFRPIMDLIFVPTAMVTITPDSRDLQGSYTLSAVPGTPDPAQNQIAARPLYASARSQDQTVPATGKGYNPASVATGLLTFYNSLFVQASIPAGTVVIGNSGVPIVTDSDVTIPPADPLTGFGHAIVTAHAANAGANGNIPALDLDSISCCGSGITVLNTDAFTSGQDATTYTYVQQSDIDRVTSTQQTMLTQTAQVELHKQIRSDEALIGLPQCVPNTDANHRAGDQADTVTVNVTLICTGEVYDAQGLQTLAANLLARDASASPGPAYIRLGNVIATILKTTPSARGAVNLLVQAQGIWVYQFTDTQRGSLVHLIAGKSSQDAQSTLLHQSGIRRVNITLSGGDGVTLPGDAQRITIAVLGVTGLRN